jgi:hypothetical protein
MGIDEVLTAPRSPWQNAYAERLIGSLRRECLDHLIVFNEAGLRRVLSGYLKYYQHSRTHLSLGKDAPIPCPFVMPTDGQVVAIPQVGVCTIDTNAARPNPSTRSAATNRAVAHTLGSFRSITRGSVPGLT